MPPPPTNMECSICIQPIETGSNLSKTECGHTFHFPCLYRWTRDHTTCPMCRYDFGTFEDEVDSPSENEFHVGTGGTGQTHRFGLGTWGYAMTHILPLLNSRPPPTYEARPIEEFTGTLDVRDVDLVMRQVNNVSRETVETCMRQCGGDIVNTIMYLVEQKGMPIPPFRVRERPEPSEPYVSCSHWRSPKLERNNLETGYESC